MDNSRSVQPISGTIPSKEVSNVFLVQVTISTKSISSVHFFPLLDSRANSCFIDKNFAQAHKISLRKLPCPTSVVVIDGRPTASGNIVEESELLSVALNNLVCVVSFNIISSPEHPFVLGLPGFELHNPNIDWRKRDIMYRQSQESTHKILTISLHELREDGCKESMFVFAVSMKPSNIAKEESTTQLPKKYYHYVDVFNKVKASTFPHHRPYDCPIDLLVTNRASSSSRLHRGKFGKRVHSTSEISSRRTYFLR